MAFSNFCCRSGGSNLNAGTRTGDTTEPGTSASFTYASGTWVQSTGVFTVASGNPSSDGVAVGDFASVYPDAASVSPFVGRITARDATTITVSLTAKAGTAPVDGTTNTTLKVGGAWKGPNAAEGFPFGFVQSTLTNSAGNPPRVNFKNDATYAITTGVSHTNAGPMAWQGYTTAYGDFGKFTLDASTNAVVILTNSGTQNFLFDAIFSNNGTTGSNTGLSFTGSRSVAQRVIAHDIRGLGIVGSTSAMIVECEAYACNGANGSTLGGFSTGHFYRCISHDNAGSNSSGFINISKMVGCIADTNGAHGVRITSGNPLIEIKNCDFYNNTGAGISSGATGGMWLIDSCNFVKNGTFGMDLASATSDIVTFNNGFGAGTQANSSGNISTAAASSMTAAEGTDVNYASDVTPWVDPANGDFRISLATAKGSGRGAYQQTAASYAGTIAYPDIGAAQHLESATGSFGMVGG